MKKNKPKILFLLHLPPPIHGSSVVGNFIRQSSRINDQFNCRFVNLLVSREVSESGKVSAHKIVGFFKIFSMLFAQLWKWKPNICYLALTVKGAAFYRDVFLIILLKLFKVKRVFHLHNKGVEIKQKNLIYKCCYKLVFKNTNIILLSEFLYADIQEFVPINRVFVCPNGIPDIIDNTEIIDKHTGCVNILFLSNLIESKGVLVLLEACSILKQEGIPFTCDFVGDEGDISTKQLNDKIEYYNLNDRINYLGKLMGKEKEEAFENAEIFVLPTYHDCFPLVIIEAMQHRLPVISTFEGGVQEMVKDGETGFLVHQKDAKELAFEMGKLILDRSLQSKMGNAGREKYEQEFTLEKFEQRLSGILQNLIN